MSITLETATVDSLDQVVEAVASWQQDGGSVQLHPGDLGWNSSFGADALARSLRVWRRDGLILAAGMVEDGLIRMALAPAVDRDESFAVELLADLSDPERGVLPAGSASVEARYGAAFRALLHENGWVADESWTPLRRDLSEKVEGCGLRIEVVDENNAPERVAVHRASFPNSTLTLERWRAVAASPPYRRARCLLGYDADDVAVAAATVWSAGPGRPGLLEPLGVHQDHRGHGYGKAISLAAAAALQALGASSATVCTPTTNTG
ncbi:GNAT family N-acetyltransferase [Kribbella sp. NPDC049584]|uniref:GNAT family N-acetyltransferase n=1 Tax=Kribbella sp. NPDC049584 TaxID=3154833 RepID=UPI00343EDF72